MKSIAFFDFDGTITKSDSFPKFIIYAKGYIKFACAAAFFVPKVVLASLLKKDTGKIKEEWFSFHFKGMKEENLKSLGNSFSLELKKKNRFRYNILDTIKELRDSGSEVIIVSASLNIWIDPFSQSLQMNYICTELEFKDGYFTGRFSTPNCKGEQKRIRIENKYNISEYERVIVYGDSSGDTEMMALATEPHWV